MNDGYGSDPRDQEQIEQRDPLVAVETEAALLGAMLTDNRLLVEYADRLKASDFAEPVHGRIFSAMLRFASKGAKATAVTLRPVFMSDPAADGGNYLAAITDSAVAVIGAGEFAAQVMDFAARRRMRQAYMDAAAAMESNFETTVGEISGGLTDLSYAVEARDEDEPDSDAAEMMDAVTGRQGRIDRGEESTGALNALISDADKLMGPLRCYYQVVAGRPGMGKTVYAHSAALGYAAGGAAGVYLHAEMDREQMAMRAAADISFALGRGIRFDDIINGRLNAADLAYLEKVKVYARTLPLRYKAIGGYTARRLYALVARYKAMLAAKGQVLQFVVIDYLGLIGADDDEGKPIDDDRKRMNAVSKMAMRIRDDLGVAVLGLAQMSRGVESRTNKRPQMSDLKESGNLEQDCDQVLMLYREEYYLERAKPKRDDKLPNGANAYEAWEVEIGSVRGKIDLILDKNRAGKTGSRQARFFGDYVAIRGLEVSGDELDAPLLNF